MCYINIPLLSSDLAKQSWKNPVDRWCWCSESLCCFVVEPPDADGVEHGPTVPHKGSRAHEDAAGERVAQHA